MVLQQQRGSIQADELSPQDKAALTGEDQQQKITTYEEAFKRIKEATGVSDTMVLYTIFVCYIIITIFITLTSCSFLFK